MGVLCGIVIALFVGGAVAVITISLCMAAKDGDTERERMEQANEILNLRLEMSTCVCVWQRYGIRWTRWSLQRDFRQFTTMRITMQ